MDKIAGQLMVLLPVGGYLVRVSHRVKRDISHEMNLLGAIMIRPIFDDVLEGLHEITPGSTFIIDSDRHPYYWECISAYVAMNQCKLFMFSPVADCDYYIKNDQLFASEQVKEEDDDLLIDSAIDHTVDLIARLQDTLIKLEDLHFHHSVKPAAKYEHHYC